MAADHDVDDLPDTGRRVRRGRGERSRRRRAARRDRRWRLARRVLLGAGLVALAVVLAGPVANVVGPWFDDLVGDRPDAAPTEDEAPVADPAAAGGDARPTMLVATFDDAGENVTGVQLFTLDRADDRGAIVLVPTTMVADVPGYGLLPVGDAGVFGGAALLELTLENQLGIAIDATVRVTEQDWAALFARVGGFDVEVAQPLSEQTQDGGTTRRFEPGAQFLDGPRLAELLTFQVPTEDELTGFARTRQVLEGFLTQAGADGALDEVFADGAPMLTTSETDQVEQVLRGLAGDDVGQRVVLRTLPVTVMGSGDGVFYRLDETRAAELVTEVFGAAEAVVEGSGGDGLRLEVLNGNGRAGVGADVASLLVPLGHTVAITRNAESFDNPTTRVLLYGDDDELLAAAQQIVDTLGVGRIEVSEVPSSIVDMTVLVGEDFSG